MRYALYYAPDPDTPLWTFGSRVIGYDAASGADVPFYPMAGVEHWDRLTAEPRTYGFHATLKAPFRLADGRSEAELIDTLADVAARLSAVTLAEGLTVVAIGPFTALTPRGDTGPVGRLALDVVTAFEPFRAPLTYADRQRRLASPLTDRQKLYLERYGYPYVADDFRFHMTLTGPLHPDLREDVVATLAERFEQAVPAGPVGVDRLVLYRQADAASRFTIIARAPLRPVR